jgi:hypothetical protein
LMLLYMTLRTNSVHRCQLKAGSGKTAKPLRLRDMDHACVDPPYPGHVSSVQLEEPRGSHVVGTIF